ncbi:hypothetical protein [Mesorhizobium tamadayense]|uniref:hypothetical protein n=1 Tax=Mesorhizobium tamadayense TaxID=425306 RepID=UPI00142D7FC8|nr:hypothetical protein [Mesorhizobium tamadayense]
MLMLQRLDVLPGLPGDRGGQHRRHVFAAKLIDDGELVGQPLVLIPVEVADQRPEAVRQGLARRRALPCGVDVVRRSDVDLLGWDYSSQRATGSAQTTAAIGVTHRHGAVSLDHA